MEDSRMDDRALQEPGQAVQELQTLFRETISLFHGLQATAASVHRHANLTAALRGVLVGLAESGPQTVPQMARLRPTSRQHIQVLVNRLRDLGLVLAEENPDHRRSKRVRLTAEGERTVARILDREARLLELAAIPVGEAEIGAAVAALQAVRTTLTGSRFRRLVEEIGSREEGMQDE